MTMAAPARDEQLPGAVRPEGRGGRRARRPIPASSASSACTTSSRPGYRGAVFAHQPRGRRGARRRDGRRRSTSCPTAPADLVFVCTPAAANPDLLRACAAKGITAAFLTSAGYGEAGDEGRRAEADARRARRRARHAARRAQRPGRGVDAGAAVRADRRPVPAGRAHRRRQPVGQLRLVVPELRGRRPASASAGRSRPATPPRSPCADYLDVLRRRPRATAVGLAYVEGIADGRAFFDRLAAGRASASPLVLVKGGATAGGQRAAASHTGALATDDRVFDGMCRQAGVTRAATVEEAFEAAATFATQPLPAGPRRRRADHRRRLGRRHRRRHHREPTSSSPPLPDDLRDAIDEKLPPRWSRNNPVDLAGGETRDTIPEVLELVAGHPDVDAVVYLGLGIQSNQARADARRALLPRPRPRADRRLPRAPGRPLRRRRRPRSSDAHRQADPHRHRARGRRPRTTPGRPRSAPAGRLCYPSANRAVAALDHLWRRAQHRLRRGLPLR